MIDQTLKRVEITVKTVNSPEASEVLKEIVIRYDDNRLVNSFKDQI